MSNLVYLGAQDPESLEVTVTPGTPPKDLSTVTTAVLRVKGPTGITEDWTAAIISQSSTLLVLEHVYELADLTAGAGRYAVVAVLTIAGKERRCIPKPIIAQDIYS